MLSMTLVIRFFFFFSSRRRHTRCSRDWSSDVCSSDLDLAQRDVWVAEAVHLDAPDVRLEEPLVGVMHHRDERRVVDRKSTRLNSSHGYISYAVFCLKKKKKNSK